MKTMTSRIPVPIVLITVCAIPFLLLLLAVPTSGCGKEKKMNGEQSSNTEIEQHVVDTMNRTVELSSSRIDSSKEGAKDLVVAKSDSVKSEKEGDEEKGAKKGKTVTSGNEECGEITDARIKAGEVVFAGKGNCYTCHKGDGTGSPLGPDLTDKTWINISGDYPSIIENIRTGVPLPIEHPTPMPAMGGGKLTDEEVCAVGAYVWSLSR